MKDKLTNHKIIDITDHNSANDSNLSVNKPGLTLTKAQFLKGIEHKMTDMLAESKYNTYKEKSEFIARGNIVTFKKPLPKMPNSQIAIAEVEVSKDGKIKLINPFGTTTPWFNNMEDLINNIDWDWMREAHS